MTAALTLSRIGRAAVALLLAATLGGGCYEERVVRNHWDNFPQDAKPEGNAGPRRPTIYSVQLAKLSGPQRHQQIADLIRQLRTQTQLVDLWVADTGTESLLHMGRYRSPNDLDARFALRAAREAQIDEKRPFRDAQILPIQTGASQAGIELDANDLRQFAGTPDYHTLEVAIFTPSHGPYRTAAQDMARKLRQQDHQAFFYHGPNASSVTVGLFTREDWDLVGTVEVYGPRIKSAQAEFPHLLIDGTKRHRIESDPTLGYEPTKIVRIPSFR